MGAARLLRGLAGLVDPKKLTVVVNTGDDDVFYGLHVSPDLDTILYTLAGLAPVGRGWGIAGDSFAAKQALARLYGEGWFQLGDRDLATHVFRTDALRRGRTLSQCTQDIAHALGVTVRVLPATDDRLRTVIHTAGGPLAFQEYLVRRRARPRVSKITYSGARSARPAPGVIDAIRGADLVLIAPSNPFVSIGPILAVPGLRGAVRGMAGRTVAVSPLVAGRAVKGPLASMLRALGHKSDAGAIAELYAGLAGTLIVADGDLPRSATRRSAARALPRRGGRGSPELVEHDILIADKAAARRLARFAVGTGLAKAGGRAHQSGSKKAGKTPRKPGRKTRR